MAKAYNLQFDQFQQYVIEVEVQVGLLVTTPQGPNLGGTAPSGWGGYSMQTISLTQCGIMCATNSDPITWTASSNWGIAEYFGIYDLGGNLLYWNQLYPPITGANGSTPTIAAGEIFVDWNNSSTGYTPNLFGRFPLDNPATVGTFLSTFAFQQNMQAVTDLPSATLSITPVSTTFNFQPRDWNVMRTQNLVAFDAIANGKLGRMLDCTMPVSTAYTYPAIQNLAF